MATDVFRIVYCSRTPRDDSLAAPDTDQILSTSRRNNARVDVTGALLVNDGLFVQVLEGSFEDVQSVFERIQADARHDEIVVLQAESVPARVFQAWSMAHVEPDNPDAVREIVSRGMVDGGAVASRLLTLLSNVVQPVPA